MPRIFVVLVTALFAVVGALTVVWLVVTGWDYETVAGAVGERGVRQINTALLGALAFTSGLLLLHHKRSNPYAEPDEQWTLSEILYALVFFASLFFGIYSVAGLYFSP